VTEEADHTSPAWPDNIVIRVRGPFYDVLTPQGVLRCVVRGALKKERRREDLVVVGDRVEVRVVAPGEGVIEAVAPRRRALVRRARDREAAQVIVANLDQLVVVMAAAQPELSLGMLDRFLVVAESQDLPTVICLNKVDLDSEGRARTALVPYRAIGYPVVETSVVTGEGLAELWQALEGKLSALAGPSGVGKTSLVKAFRPELDLRIGAVSEATGRGRHTTTERADPAGRADLSGRYTGYRRAASVGDSPGRAGAVLPGVPPISRCLRLPRLPAPGRTRLCGSRGGRSW